MEKFSFYTLDSFLTSLTNALDADGKVAFAVAHNYRIIKDKITEYTDKKSEIIHKYGKEVDGVITITDDEKLAEANKELTEFAEMEVSVDILKIPEIAFENCNLNARQIVELSWMIEKSEEKKPVTKPKGSDKERFGFDI